MRNVQVKISPEKQSKIRQQKELPKHWELLQQMGLLYSLQREAQCLKIIKRGKNSKAFQNSFLIFHITDNKVLLCFSVYHIKITYT